MKMERVRDKVERGKRGREWVREQRRDGRTKWQKELKKHDGVEGGEEEAVEGCKEARSAAALLLEAIICSDVL